MPAGFVVHGMHSAPELRTGFESRGMCDQHIHTTAIEGFRRRQQRRHHHRRRVTAHMGAAVVVIEHVRGHTVDQGRIQRAGAAGRAQHQRLTAVQLHAYHFRYFHRRFFCHARERYAQRIHHADPAPVQRRLR